MDELHPWTYYWLYLILLVVPITFLFPSSRGKQQTTTMDENKKKRLASEALTCTNNNNDVGNSSNSLPPSSVGGSGQELHVANLIQFARSSYTENPTEALSALLEAMKLNNGQAAADSAMNRVRAELGDGVMDHVLDTTSRRDRAVQAVRQLLHDESTFLYQQGREDILRQTMEDGSSVVCTKCGGVVASSRWQQHLSFWCTSASDNNTTSVMNNDQGGDSSVMDIE